MILSIYAIRDNKVGAFMQPFYMNTNAAAIRAFDDLVNDGKSGVNKHPEDYELYLLGVYDDNTGRITQDDQSLVQRLVTAKDCLNAPTLPVPRLA